MEKNFLLNDYKNTNEYKQSKDTAKLEHFFEYIEEVYPMNKHDNSFFQSLDKDDFLHSIEYYVEKMGGPAQNTVGDYKRALISFFKEVLYREYEIRNTTFFDAELKEIFDSESKYIINNLKTQESKEYINDEDYIKLIRKINEYKNKEGLSDEVLYSIKNYEKKGSKKKYNNFVSIIAIKLVMEFALKNQVIADIKFTDLSITDKMLKVNGFDLSLNDDIIELLEQYIIYRDIVINRNNSKSNILFLNIDGNPFRNTKGKGKNNVDASSLFAYLQDIYGEGKSGTSKIAYRKIIQLLDEGCNIATISKLTGYSSDTIGDLYGDAGSTFSQQKEKLVRMLKEKTNFSMKMRSKGLLRCPFCGERSEAIAENWVLRETLVKNKIILRIACKECEGINGEYRY